MDKILYIGPDVKGRYKGGIMTMYLSFKKAKQQNLLNFDGYNFELFNSHALRQSKNSEGQFRLENILQSIHLCLRLFFKLKDDNYRIIHYNTSASWPMIKDLLILNLANIFSRKSKLLFHIHFCGIENVFVKNFIFRNIQLYLLKKNDIIVLSNAFKNDLISMNFKRDKVHFLPNFHNENVDLIKSQISHHEIINLLFIGSISTRKGFLDLLQSLFRIEIKYILNVMGDFENENIKTFCFDYINEHKLNVKFHGYKSGVVKADIIRNSQILILPSYAEGFPLVIPEALSYGLVVVSTYISAIPEIIQNNDNGFLFYPGDIVELKSILEKLYNDRDLLRSVSIKSFNSSKKYTFKNHILELNNIYNNILNNHE